jgi:opacity protein-like surface antigen
MRSAALILIVALVSSTGSGVAAQSLQRFSIQASGATLFATAKDPNFDSKTRLGIEGQLRYTLGRYSVGAGYQRVNVFAFKNNPLTLSLSLAFVEPRLVVVAGSGVAAYLAARLGAGKLICSKADECGPQSYQVSYGGGGGLLFRLSNRVSADLGSQYFQANSTSGYVLARAGLSFGL